MFRDKLTVYTENRLNVALTFDFGVFLFGSSVRIQTPDKNIVNVYLQKFKPGDIGVTFGQSATCLKCDSRSTVTRMAGGHCRRHVLTVWYVIMAACARLRESQIMMATGARLLRTKSCFASAIPNVPFVSGALGIAVLTFSGVYLWFSFLVRRAINPLTAGYAVNFTPVGHKHQGSGSSHYQSVPYSVGRN